MFLLPKTPRELNWFYGVSFAAGVCEEILYRGFLIWYFANWIGSVPALFVSSLAFGIAHSYQGAANIPRTALIGLWMGIIYLVSNSLWLPMLAHFVYDVIGGRLIYSVASADAATTPREAGSRS
jgi:membrane protease YdiL (CAAX protease family)